MTWLCMAEFANHDSRAHSLVVTKKHPPDRSLIPILSFKMSNTNGRMAKHPLGTHGEYTKIECTVKVLQRSITFRFLMPLFMGASSAGEDWFLLDKPADNVALQCSEFKNFKRVNANAVTLISLVPWLAFSSAPSL